MRAGRRPAVGEAPWGVRLLVCCLLVLTLAARGGAECSEDFSGDGTIGATDLAIISLLWLSAGDGSRYDLDGDGTIGAGDLARLYGIWGLSCVSWWGGTEEWAARQPCLASLELVDADGRRAVLLPEAIGEALLRPPVVLVCSDGSWSWEPPGIAEEPGAGWWCR